MKFTKDRLKTIGKRAVTYITCAFAAATLALGAVVDTPDELFSCAPQAAHVVACAEQEDHRAAVAQADGETTKKERLRDKLRRLFLSQPSAIKGVLLLPFWAIGKVLIGLISLLFTALNPVLHIILGVLLHALLLFGLFLVVLKLLFPNLKLKDLLTKRNIILLVCGSLVLSATDAILRTFWEDYRPISIAIKLTVALIVLSLLYWKVFGKRTPRKPILTV